MCGVFGVFGATKAAERTVIGLHGNQHRAREFAGIATSEGTNIFLETGVGLAREIFSDLDKLNRLHGRHALGHVRYSTTERKADDKYRNNIQPIKGWYGGKEFALAHNGNLYNLEELQRLLGAPRATTMDSEYIVRLLEKWQTGNLVEDLKKVFSHLKGSYSLGILFPDRLVAVRDPSGCRPLSLGKFGESYCISSETCGFSGVGAEHIRDVEAGQIVCIDNDGPKTWPFAQPKLQKCRFEGNYFSLPTSLTFGEAVDEYRLQLGRALQDYCPTPGADIVTPVPDSSNYIAMGYAESGKSGSWRPVITRSHYGRSFIAASQVERDETVALKFSFSPHAIEGKSIVVVDDSIVRGTTLRKVITEMRRYKPREIHVRSGSPKIRFPCIYGIDTPDKSKLIAATHSKKEICAALEADSVQFLPLEAQKELSTDPKSFCFACMDGEYRI
jgi:amidophosphoribosyltransferase